MDVAEILTPDPWTARPDLPASEAFLLMHAHDVRHLPVVEDGRLVGVVSDRDLLDVIGWMPGVAPAAPRAKASKAVRDVMHADTESVTPQDSVVNAAVQMSVRKIGCLPVLEGEKLVGIVTLVDLLRAYAAACRHGGLEGDVDPPVSRHMTAKVHTLSPRTPLRDAVGTSAALRVRHLPVTDGGKLVGILSDRDLRAAVSSGQPLAEAVASIMTLDPLTISPAGRLSDAADVLAREKISALPVVEGGRLVGILTVSDMVAHCIDTLREPEDEAGA